MPRREMSRDEWLAQQFPYLHNVMSPQDMQNEFRHKATVNIEEEELRKEKLETLTKKLIGKVREKIAKNLTRRQKEVIELYLISKKQEDMGSILEITQEAVHSRLSIAFKRLKKVCDKDAEIQEIKKEIRKS